jgi:hypothetical protein
LRRRVLRSELDVERDSIYEGKTAVVNTCI